MTPSLLTLCSDLYPLLTDTTYTHTYSHISTSPLLLFTPTHRHTDTQPEKADPRDPSNVPYGLGVSRDEGLFETQFLLNRLPLADPNHRDAKESMFEDEGEVRVSVCVSTLHLALDLHLPVALSLYVPICLCVFPSM